MFELFFECYTYISQNDKQTKRDKNIGRKEKILEGEKKCKQISFLCLLS